MQNMNKYLNFKCVYAYFVDAPYQKKKIGKKKLGDGISIGLNCSCSCLSRWRRNTNSMDHFQWLWSVWVCCICFSIIIFFYLFFIILLFTHAAFFNCDKKKINICTYLHINTMYLDEWKKNLHNLNKNTLKIKI